MVFSVRDEDDCAVRTGALLLVNGTETADGCAQSLPDSRSLCFDEIGFDGIEEHLRRHIVTGNRQLHERIACKDHQSHFVVHHIIHQFAQHLFGAVQTVGRHVFSQHRVRNIQSYDGFYALPFLRAFALPELRTGGSDNEQTKRNHDDGELHSRAHMTRIRHQLLH